VDCDAFGLTADVSGIKVPGDPLTDGNIHFSFVYISLILMFSRGCEADFCVLEGV
jgi:hypothetical protein